MRKCLITLFLLFFSSTGWCGNVQQIKDLKNIRAIIFDMDGVLRRGYEPLPGSSEIVNWMKESDIPGMILTNECRYVPKSIHHDLRKMGINLPSEWPILTSALAVQDFLETKVYCEGDLFVYVVGEAGIKAAVSQVMRDDFHFCTDLPRMISDKDELIVVFGAVDKIQINELEEASIWINVGAKVITTCPDVSDPSSKGAILIGMPNHLIHMLKMHAPCIPYCLGKPHAFMISKALEVLKETIPNIKKEEILFVGDSLDTDIRLAFEAEIPTALVLTGNTREEMVSSYIIRPNFVFPSVKELFLALKSEVHPKDSPPSIVRISPVTHGASSEAR